MTMITIFESDQIRTQFFLVVISDNVTHVILSGKTFANWYSKGCHWVESPNFLSEAVHWAWGAKSHTRPKEC